MQERGRDRFNHSQQSWFNQNPNSWFTQAEQIRQSSPEYWQRWMMPLYQQFGYGTPQVGPGGQSQMIPSVISGMLGS
jgi:hypothetical protein